MQTANFDLLSNLLTLHMFANVSTYSHRTSIVMVLSIVKVNASKTGKETARSGVQGSDPNSKQIIQKQIPSGYKNLKK